MTHPDTRADELYDRLRADFGEGSPKASGYRFEHSFFGERALVLEAVGSVSGTLVDVACGAGLMTMPLAEAGCLVVGVDFNAAACLQARRNGLHAVRGDAFNLPLMNGSAAVVVNMEFAQQYELEAMEQMLHEVARVLCLGGRLALVWRNGQALAHRAAHGIFAHLDRRRGRSPFTLIDHTPTQMQTAGEKAGLTLERMFAIFPPLRMRLRRADGLLARLIGSSFMATFRR